jgi:hypothetical protein
VAQTETPSVSVLVPVWLLQTSLSARVAPQALGGVRTQKGVSCQEFFQSLSTTDNIELSVMSQNQNSEGLETIMRRNLTSLEEQKAALGHVPARDCAAHQARTIMFLMAGSLVMGFVMLKCRDLWFGPQQHQPHIHRKRDHDDDDDSQSDDEAREQDKSEAIKKEAQQKEQHQQQNHREEYRYHFSMKDHLSRECQDDLATLDDEYAKSVEREEEEDEDETGDDQTSGGEAPDVVDNSRPGESLPSDDAGRGDNDEAEGGDIGDDDLVMTEGEHDNVEGSYVVVSKRKKDL